MRVHYPDPLCEERIIIDLYYDLPARDDFHLHIVNDISFTNKTKNTIKNGVELEFKDLENYIIIKPARIETNE